MNKVYLLHGQQAVRTYSDGTIEEVKESGEFETSVIEWDEQSKVVDIIREVIAATDGWFDTCMIEESDYTFLNND